MDDSNPNDRKDLSQELVNGWTFGDDDDSSLTNDSLLAPPPQKRAVTPGPARRPSTLRGPCEAETQTGDQLFQAFALAGEPSLADSELDVNVTTTPAAHAEPAAPGRVEQINRGPLTFPRVGALIGGFHLIAELGRGAFARVFLAEQASLGRRLVALKVSRAEGEEPQILARLQHSHIVPIYSVHDEPDTPLRLMCMPYLGGANLAQVLEAAGAKIPSQQTGHTLVDALDVVSNRLQAESKVVLPSATSPTRRRRQSARTVMSLPGPTGDGPASQAPAHSQHTRSTWSYLPNWGRSRSKPEPPPTADDEDFDQPARQFLRAADSIQAAVWIVARLAEGLDHAHSRGLLHRDLKPSNILIAGDGVPMLLDFNLSAEVEESGPSGGAKAMLGGTLPYMAPEHLDAFDPNSPTSAEAVDERSDIYALGLILFEIVSGEHPFPEPPGTMPIVPSIRFMKEHRNHAPSLRAVRDDVPWSLDSIVAKALDPNPEQRYQRARDLSEDLRRFLEYQPLKFAPEPSYRERFDKWKRRHPALCSTSVVAAALTVILATVIFSGALLAGHFRNIRAEQNYAAFQRDFKRSQFYLNTDALTSHYARGIALADNALKRLGFDQQGNWNPDAWLRRKIAPNRQKIHEQITELILLEAQAKVYRADRIGSEGDRRAALESALHWLGKAEQIDPNPPSSLYLDRARYLRALGNADAAAQEAERAAKIPLISGRDFTLRGTSLLAQHDLKGAEQALRTAIYSKGQIDSFWAWFALGLCLSEKGRFLEAADVFDTCTALEPNFAWAKVNRGLALARIGRFSEALDCYDRAISDNSNFAEAYVNRALTRLSLNDPKGAEGDLRKAIELGREDANVLAALGQVLVTLGHRDEGEELYAQLLKDQPNNTMYLVARGIFRLDADPKGARADLEHVLGLKPQNALAHYGIARLVRPTDPSKALKHLEEALEADPGLIEAYQLRALIRAHQGDVAALDDIDRLFQSPTPEHLYNASCALAVLSQHRKDPALANRAVLVLGQALEVGVPASLVLNDDDWKPFHDRADFQKAVRKSSPPRPKQP